MCRTSRCQLSTCQIPKISQVEFANSSLKKTTSAWLSQSFSIPTYLFDIYCCNLLWCLGVFEIGLPDFKCKIPKWGKYTKRPQHIPRCHKIKQMTTKYVYQMYQNVSFQGLPKCTNFGVVGVKIYQLATLIRTRWSKLTCLWNLWSKLTFVS
jgi:hypothetical protein